MAPRNKVFSFALTLLALIWAPADAGFFSRLANMRVDEEGNKEEGLAIVEQGIVHSVLQNSSTIPLVGLSVANLPPEVIPAVVSLAIQEDKKTRLIDTSQGTETLVAHGILSGVERMQQHLTEKVQVHVVAKILHTHLGYERTKLAVGESLRAFDPVLKSGMVDLRLHFLLHWPRCYGSIMNCGQDEATLPTHVKQAGADPSVNPDGAWKESWRALEDIYLSQNYPIESIGVANFNLNHIEEMESFARIRPGMVQANLWSLLYDHKLTEYCQNYGIHVEVYDIMEGTLSSPEKAPRAYHHIQNIAVEHSTKDGIAYTPVQVLFAWLIQHGLSIVPVSSSMETLSENSAAAITNLPAFDDTEVETLAHAVEAYLSGKDMDLDTPVKVIFHAATKDMVLYWMTDNVDEVKVALVRAGQSYNETSYPGHVYRLYDAKDKNVFVDHVIQAHVGLQETVHVDLQAQGLSSQTETIMGSSSVVTGDKPNVFNWLGGGVLQGQK